MRCCDFWATLIGESSNHYTFLLRATSVHTWRGIIIWFVLWLSELVELLDTKSTTTVRLHLMHKWAWWMLRCHLIVLSSYALDYLYLNLFEFWGLTCCERITCPYEVFICLKYLLRSSIKTTIVKTFTHALKIGLANDSITALLSLIRYKDALCIVLCMTFMIGKFVSLTLMSAVYFILYSGSAIFPSFIFLLEHHILYFIDILNFQRLI